MYDYNNQFARYWRILAANRVVIILLPGLRRMSTRINFLIDCQVSMSFIWCYCNVEFKVVYTRRIYNIEYSRAISMLTLL